MRAIQLDFFKSDEQCQIDQIRSDVNKIKTSSDNVRKGTYARINELKKELTDVQIRLQILEKFICENKSTLA